MMGTRQFRGMFPKVSPRLLGENAAQEALNCWLDAGYPRPLPVPRLVSGVGTFPVGVRSIWRYDANRWFAWSQDVDVVRSPLNSDTLNSVIWSGQDYPRHTSTAIMQGHGFSGVGLPPASRRLGVPAPTIAPTTNRADLSDANDDAVAEHHAWVYTFLTDLDEEGPPSPPSATVQRGFNTDGTIQSVTIGMPTGVTGSYGVNRKRLYRTATGASGVTTWNLVATLALSTANYTDTVLTAGLGDALVSEQWDPPPADLTGLISLPNGVLAGFRDRDVYFSVPFQPHAWPSDYIQTVDDAIVGLGNFGTNLLVGTRGKPVLISGADPERAFPSRMEFEQPCAAKRSFATVDRQGVAFASTEGLVLVTPGGGEFISREAYDRKDWQDLAPAEFRSVYHDGSYIAFSNSKAVALNPSNEGAIDVEGAGVRAVYRDPMDDAVYVVGSDRRLYEWATDVRAGDTARTMTWKSRLETGIRRTWSAAQVIAEGYPVTLKLYGDRGLVLTRVVNSAEPFRLPAALKRYANWEWEVSGQNGVEEVRIGRMMDMLEQ